MDYPAEIDLRPTLAGLLATARAVSEDFPGLRNVPMNRAWAGSLPYTADMVPVIDEVRPGLFLAAGHVFGNAAGPMTGRLMAQLLQGREPELDLSEARFERPLAPIEVGAAARW
jgi:glycine/D-amino acid oxidase-like deaminating enzyme